MVFTFLFGLGGRTQYMYAIMLTIMSLNALVLCQVTKFTCLFCGEHGSPHYYAARVLSICLGCLAPVLVKPPFPSCYMKPLSDLPQNSKVVFFDSITQTRPRSSPRAVHVTMHRYVVSWPA